MAIMWPRSLPRWVTQDPRRSAECKVYSQLAQSLDDAWSVYYSRPWWGVSPTGGEIDGEADFVVAHPEWGVLFLEVKGGLVAHDPKTGKWTSKDRNGVSHGIKDPMGQAMKSKHELHKKFRVDSLWPARRVRIRHGVVLPDCNPTGVHLVGGYEQELFCFATDLKGGLVEWLTSRLRSHSKGPSDQEVGPGVAGISVIDRTIAAPARLAVPLHRELEADMAQQDILLTGAQMQAIVFIDTLERAVVEGGAGTGKTVIASELVAKYAGNGKRTLLCCLSEPLAGALRKRLGKRPRLDVMTLSDLRAASGEARYDAVVVDEGQDVEWSDWDLLEGRVDDGGWLRVLFDSNQAVYRARDDLETRLQARSVPLRLNLRNSLRIAEVTEPLYRGPLITCFGAEGKQPVLIECSAADSISQAAASVRELVRGQGLPCSDVAVLVPDNRSAEKITSGLKALGLRVTDAMAHTSGAVVVETIARFKGLEAMAVVVLTDRLCANNAELSYVGVSRGRALLVVVGPTLGTKLGQALDGRCDVGP